MPLIKSEFTFSPAVYLQVSLTLFNQGSAYGVQSVLQCNQELLEWGL